MHKLSKIICSFILCCFVFTTSAGNLLCSCNLPNESDTQQSTPGTTSSHCHDEQDISPDESSYDCCQDMSLCNGFVFFVADTQLATIQMSHDSVLIRTNEHFVYNTSTPPTPPPKLVF